MEQSISFEQMPRVIAQISSKLEAIESLLQQQSNPIQQKDEDELFGVEEAANFLGLSVQTIYGKVSKGDLPVMKRSKKLYFSKLDLMQYLRQGRKKSNQEIEEEAQKYLNQ